MTVDESYNDNTQLLAAMTRSTLASHYWTVNKIGAGGMGKVALKFLPPHLCKEDECRRRFRREAQAAAKLDHPNIEMLTAQRVPSEPRRIK